MEMEKQDTFQLIGPFKQLLTMEKLPLKGSLTDEQLVVKEDVGILIHKGIVSRIDAWNLLKKQSFVERWEVIKLEGDFVGMPGLIDAHTHICWAGSRARDYSMRLSGKSYLEIAEQGGGIWSTVTQTRAASQETLVELICERAERLYKEGVMCIEVKSGYGLTVQDELKMLRAIKEADSLCRAKLIPTCLAAHICPKDFEGSTAEYLYMIENELWPKVLEEQLAERIDIFIEQGAFSEAEACDHLLKAKSMGFEIAVHADQFSCGGSWVAIQAGAKTAEHLEASGHTQIERLAQSDVVAVVLPGCSMGIGDEYAPARTLLDSGCSVVIASDWNPGSAPMGDLLMQASVMGAHQSLSCAEILSGITYRAASALSLSNYGTLVEGNVANIIGFKTSDYRDILWNQGKLKPQFIWGNRNE